MKVNPAGQDAAWSVCVEAACMGVCKVDREIISFGWWRQGCQRRGQYLKNIRMNAQNLATCLGRKGRSS